MASKKFHDSEITYSDLYSGDIQLSLVNLPYALSVLLFILSQSIISQYELHNLITLVYQIRNDSVTAEFLQSSSAVDENSNISRMLRSKMVFAQRIKAVILIWKTVLYIPCDIFICKGRSFRNRSVRMIIVDLC